MKKVTLAMPVFNGERYISAAIESILAQDYPEIELVISDNSSTDATQAICADFARQDKRVRYSRNVRNLGAAPNYNRGFELATGEYLKWCAHDDVISPGYVSACVASLEADPDATLAFGRTICIDPDGNPTAGEDVNETPPILDGNPARRLWLALSECGTCFPIFGVFRMDFLRRSTLHRSYYGSDRALVAEAALLGKVLLAEDAVMFNREHPSRSIRLTDHGERSRWQDSSASGRGARMEHVSRFLHFIEVAGRHPEVANPWAARLQVLRFEASPLQLGRLSLDLVRFISPELVTNARRLARTARDGSL